MLSVCLSVSLSPACLAQVRTYTRVAVRALAKTLTIDLTPNSPPFLHLLIHCISGPCVWPQTVQVVPTDLTGLNPGIRHYSSYSTKQVKRSSVSRHCIGPYTGRPALSIRP
ncbi:unnamed protein product [Ectocarpus sp. 13 AM-2016]